MSEASLRHDCGQGRLKVCLHDSDVQIRILLFDVIHPSGGKYGSGSNPLNLLSIIDGG